MYLVRIQFEADEARQKNLLFETNKLSFDNLRAMIKAMQLVDTNLDPRFQLLVLVSHNKTLVD